MLKYYTIFILLLNSAIFAQSNIEFNGYLQNMQTTWAPKVNQELFLSNSISNRFNFNWYASESIKLSASIRNIFDYGDFVRLVPFYSEVATMDNGYLDFTEKISSGKSYLLYTNIDRLNLSYTFNKLEIQIGRQRVNWGISSVWTPNDIFNSSSFINFDYAEKPGSDAIRLQYYFDFASSFELVTKLNYDKDITIAGKLQINQWDYDFQFLSGLSVDDYIFGAGWSGNISDAGFTGEFSYFMNRNDNKENENLFVSSIGANYMFSNSLFLNAEFLYNSSGKLGKANSSINLFNIDYSAKQLSPAMYSIFGSMQYPITPLISSSVAAILNPSDGSLFVSPNVEFSINEAVYLLISGQFFLGDNFTEWGNYGQFYYFRVKWNF